MGLYNLSYKMSKRGLLEEFWGILAQRPFDPSLPLSKLPGNICLATAKLSNSNSKTFEEIESALLHPPLFQRIQIPDGSSELHIK
jgi:hypothetical protein